MCLHPHGSLVASGQRPTHGLRLSAVVHVWDSRSLRTLHVLGDGEMGAGVRALDFSSMVGWYVKIIKTKTNYQELLKLYQERLYLF